MASPLLLGDSIFKRLYAQNRGLFDSLSSKFCVSGQTVSDLYSLVHGQHEVLMGRTVYVLIGANDVLQRTPQQQFMLSLRTLVRYLCRLKCNVHLCEILPIPRLGRKANASPAITKYNNFIRSCEPGGKIKVVRLFNYFCNGEDISCNLYEKYIGPARRTDLVHPNRDGLEVLLISIEGV